MAKRVKLVMVGGFLGSGKTTLLRLAASWYKAAGMRVGLIMNDQASNLVDTQILQREGLAVSEVSGGCFCCRFQSLVKSVESLVESEAPDVILGEPVGSCTDLSATVLQPLKDLYQDRLETAPLSVLADPGRLREAFTENGGGRFAESVYYIFRKQLEEADAIAVSKSDLLSSAELSEIQQLVKREFPERPVLAVSSRTGSGFDSWLGLLRETKISGQRIATVDYDEYAQGEAALGWLNARIQVEAAAPEDWTAFGGNLLRRMQELIRVYLSEVAHIKLLLETSKGCVVGNLTGVSAEPAISGETQGLAQTASLIVNARAHMDPGALREVFEASLRTAAGGRMSARILDLEAFSPARPVPTYRYKVAV